MSPNSSLAEGSAGCTVLKQLVLGARGSAGARFLFKGGDPAARSRTATLLRLHPSRWPHRGERPPEG